MRSIMQVYPIMSDNKKPVEEDRFRRMSEALSNDLVVERKKAEQIAREKAELEKALKEREEALKAREDEFRSREEAYQRMQSQVDAIKEEKKKQFEGIIQKEVRPYLEQLRKSAPDNTQFSTSIDTFESQLSKGLDNAFMDKESMATLQTIHAAASANQVTSSKLEEVFQNHKTLQTRVEAAEKAKEDIDLLLKKTQEEKDKEIEELKKTLDELHKKHTEAAANINNAKAHFPMEDEVENNTATVAATASSDSSAGQFGSLFSFDINPNWRAYRDA